VRSERAPNLCPLACSARAKLKRAEIASCAARTYGENEMHDQQKKSDVAVAALSTLDCTTDCPTVAGRPAARWPIVLFGVAIPLCFWGLVINWSTEYVREDLEKQDRPQVKPVEIRQLDLDSWRKTVGIQEK
jgi:hypothetical protein